MALLRLVDSFRDQGWSNQAINVLLSAADNFVTWCEHPELQANVRLEREQTIQPEMSRAEYLRLLSAAKLMGTRAHA